MLSDQTDYINSVKSTGVSDEGTSLGRVAIPQYAPDRHRETGCGNLSLSSRKIKSQETQPSNCRFSNNNNKKISKHKKLNFKTINIATQNVRTLGCDVKFASTIQEAKNLKLDILALQETRRPGSGQIELETEGLVGWFSGVV